MKRIICLWMAGFALFVSSNLAMSKTLKYAPGSPWPTFVDFSRLSNKQFKAAPPANKKTQPKKNKR